MLRDSEAVENGRGVNGDDLGYHVPEDGNGAVTNLVLVRFLAKPRIDFEDEFTHGSSCDLALWLREFEGALPMDDQKMNKPFIGDLRNFILHSDFEWSLELVGKVRQAHVVCDREE